ncbi:PREDICTED: protein EI24 homolog [Theobroma cacao]|uniref:Protein EI24 homolog n=1 Tax=Theobroma cacao TaxID=3641 RepID=A0AB32VYW1_THECC|nr:PREDICTED: protein EI24 homolog [Theobroma cacao]
MEDRKLLIKISRTKLKQASLLWADGFREACCLHRVIVLCRRSRQLLIRTGQCFLLNGFIFLGSLFVLNSVVIPILRWILPDQRSQISYGGTSAFDGVLNFYSFLRGLLVQLFYVFWFYPLYVFSFILSNLWYNDIAKHGFAAMGRSGPSVVESSKQKNALNSDSKMHAAKPAGLGWIMIEIGEQVYSVLLLSFFFLEVYATGFIPYVGKALNFLLLSWMYAYYCFEYKWNFSEWGLEKRLDFFETNWAFFAGFGSPCVLAIFFFSPLVSYGVMAILFPLFVLTATGTEAEQVISTQKGKWSGAKLGRLPVFYAVDNLLRRVLSLLPVESQKQALDNKSL